MFEPVNWPAAEAKIAGSKILVVGDLMLDHYRFGLVERLSGEATPSLQEIPARSITMIGAAGNVLHNLRALGADPQIASVIGTDQAGDMVLAFFTESDVEPPLILEGLETLSRQRIIDMASRQCMLRVDQGRALDNPFFERKTFEAMVIDKIPRCDGVVISDYGYGVLTPQFTRDIISEAALAEVPVIVAAKRPHRKSSMGCTAMIMNLAEFLVVCPKWGIEVPGTNGSVVELLECVAAARTAVNTGMLVVTMGSQGAAVATDGYQAHMTDDAAVPARSTVGAGDVFVATLSALLVAGEDPIAAAAVAVKAATHATRTDVTCLIGAKELTEIMRCPGTLDLDLVAEWRTRVLPGQTVGLTNGCFDKLHAGHLATLRWARARCSHLVVAINSDISVAKRKGEGRPMQPLAQRVAALNALDCVDYVVAFDADTPVDIITALRPDILVKGGEYEGRMISGSDQLHEWGGKLLIAPHLDGFSTTALVEDS